LDFAFFQKEPYFNRLLAPAPGKFVIHTIKQGLVNGDKRFHDFATWFDTAYSAPLEKEMKAFKERPVEELVPQAAAPPEEDDVPF
jgi:hypothetical protein